MTPDQARALLVQLDRIATALEAQVAMTQEVVGAHPEHSTPEEVAAAEALRERELALGEQRLAMWHEHNRLHQNNIPHGADGENPYH